MDLDKLKAKDSSEWWAAHPVLYGVGESVAKHWSNKLTGIEIEDVIEAAIAVVFEKIDKIRSEVALKAFLATTVRNKMMGAVRSKSGPRSKAGRTDSLDEKIEQSGDFEEFGVLDSPDKLLIQAELVRVFREITAPIDPEDLSVVWDKKVEGLKERLIGEKHGWTESSVGKRYQLARERIEKQFRADPKAAKLLKELGWERYLDE